MKTEVLSEIPFSLDMGALLQGLHIDPGTEDAGELGELVDQARQVAKPKAVCKQSYVEAKGQDTVTMDGVTFTSAVLRANLDTAERVFPYVATCGRELDEIRPAPGDFVRQYWFDAIKAALLGSSVRHLNAHLLSKYALAKSSTMSPGSGDVTVWPIEQQQLLFSLLGNVQELIGVELTDSFLMIPNKSVSGIRFPTEIDFRSCQLCRRENCPSRSAPFDSELWRSLRHGMESEA